MSSPLELITPLTFGVALISILLTCLYFKLRPYYPPSNIPITPTHPFIGSLIHLNKHWNELPDFVVKYNSLFPKKTYCIPVANVGLLGGALFNLQTEECIQHVLKVSLSREVER